METPKHTNTVDGEIDASDTDDPENRIQDNLFRPSGVIDFETPTQPLCFQMLRLDDTVIVNCHRRRLSHCLYTVRV